MKKKIAVGALLVVLLGLIAYRFIPNNFPDVFINETKNEVDEKAIIFSMRMGRAIQNIDYGVLLLKSLPENQNIKVYASKKLTELKLGDTTNSRAILIVLNESKPELKIEVSYSLEGILPDALINKIEKAASTYLIHGNRADFITEFIIRVGLVLKQRMKPDHLAEFFGVDQQFALSRFRSGGAGVRNALKTVDELVEKLQSGDFAYYKNSENPKEVLELYLQSLAKGIGDPRLPLLTDGSKLYRMEYPKSRGQIFALSEDFIRASPYELVVGDKIAYAFFNSNEPVLPIVLVKQEEDWFIDEPKSWAYFQRFEDSSTYFRKFNRYPGAELWSKAISNLREYIIYGGLYSAPLSIYPQGKRIDVLNQEHPEKRLRTSGDKLWQLHKELGDIYYFEIYWISQAIYHYEQSIKANPWNVGLRWHLSNLYLMNSQIDEYVSQIQKAACLTPIKKFEYQELRHQHELAYSFSTPDWHTRITKYHSYGALNLLAILWFKVVSCNLFINSGEL